MRYAVANTRWRKSMNYLPNEYRVAISIFEHNVADIPASLSALTECFDGKLSKQSIADCLRWLLDTGVVEKEWIRISDKPWTLAYRISEKDTEMVRNLEIYYSNKAWHG